MFFNWFNRKPKLKSEQIFKLRSMGYDARNRKVELWECEFGFLVKVEALEYNAHFIEPKEAAADYVRMIVNTQK